jgi:hypothetical protein
MTSNVTTAPQGSTAVAALQHLKAGLQNVQQNIVTAGGDPFLRLLKDGSWVYGAENIEVEQGSVWAVNPVSLQHGFVSWTNHPGKQTNEIVGEVMVPMTSPLPLQSDLRDTGWDWDQQLSFQMRCTSGEDAGEQTLYKTTSVGGMSAVKKLISEIMKQLDVNPSRPVPLIELKTDSYQHKKWGLTFTPVFEVVGWASMEGNSGADRAAEAQERGKPVGPAGARVAPSTAPEPEPENKPVRRRRGGTEGHTVGSDFARQTAEQADRETAGRAGEPRETAAAAAPASAATDQPLRRRRR